MCKMKDLKELKVLGFFHQTVLMQRVFLPRKLAFPFTFFYWKKRKHKTWELEPDVYMGSESSCN